MIETIYTELPFEKIDYMDRPEFHNEEKEFKKALTISMTKYGIKDPVYCWANGKAYGDIIKVIVGNNRMVVAKELGIKIIPAIVVQFNAENSDLKGKVLNSDDEIKRLFHVPHEVDVRRHKEEGWIDQIVPYGFRKDYSLYQGCFKI